LSKDQGQFQFSVRNPLYFFFCLTTSRKTNRHQSTSSETKFKKIYKAEVRLYLSWLARVESLSLSIFPSLFFL